MKEDIKIEIELPEKTAVVIGHLIRISGPQGDVAKKLAHPKIKIVQEGNKIVLESKKATKKEKKIINTFRAHLNNMIQGVNKKHIYRLKICSGHFPMSLSISGGELIIKNFFGESVPRKLSIKKGAEVKVEGNEITVTSASKEIAGQVAADIEHLTKIKNRDLRIFQDGCYLTHKSGKDL